MRSILDCVKRLRADRDRHARAITALDQQLAEARALLDDAFKGPRDRSTKAAKKRNERTNERTNERARRGPSRSLPEVSKKGEAILTALRAKSPQSPGDLAKVLKLRPPTLAYQMKPLLKIGAVVASGKTADRQFSLPPRSRAAKEAP